MAFLQVGQVTSIPLPQRALQFLNVPVTHQCKRRAWRKADRPSMTRRIATVKAAKAANMKKRPKLPPRLLTLRPTWITMVQSTSESSARRRERRGLSEHSTGRLQFIYIAKIEVKQIPIVTRWENSEEQQFLQASKPGCCPQLLQAVQGRPPAQLSFALFRVLISIHPWQLLAERYASGYWCLDLIITS